MTEHDSTASDYPQQVGSIDTVGVLAASLALRLPLDELEWLHTELGKRAEVKRRKAGEEFVMASYRDAWEPTRQSPPGKR